jgi:SAM-dependent methyltransferase
MKRCLACSEVFVAAGWTCPACGQAPALREGRLHFAIGISGADESYDPAWYSELARLESGNFWFGARNRLIGWLARRHLRPDIEFLEIGCGTGYVLQMLGKEFPGWRMRASEAHAEGLEFAAGRVGGKVEFAQMDARAIPYREEFDAIGAFDVIEHIREDVEVLREIHAALKPGGVLLASVPQHMFLWSKFDEIGCHVRRYSMAELGAKLAQTGFQVVETTSFNSLLLPVMWLSRLTKKERDNVDVLDELRLGRAPNAVLSAVLAVEFALVRAGVRWPAGGSRVVVARKRGPAR